MTDDAPRLFEVEPIDPVPGPDVGRGSYLRRLTQLREAKLAAGIHPVNDGPVSTDPAETCGTCSHLVTNENGNGTRRFFKCGRISITNGPKTDIRLAWPGCDKWEQHDG